jgi:hypothetical protein
VLPSERETNLSFSNKKETFLKIPQGKNAWHQNMKKLFSFFVLFFLFGKSYMVKVIW